MIDPSIIDERIRVARDRDSSCTNKLQGEIARLAVLRPFGGENDLNSLDTIKNAFVPAPRVESGMGIGIARPLPQDGSYATQLWSAICFMVDARAELKLLELIASPDFYSALMKSAGTIEP